MKSLKKNYRDYKGKVLQNLQVKAEVSYIAIRI